MQYEFVAFSFAVQSGLGPLLLLVSSSCPLLNLKVGVSISVGICYQNNILMRGALLHHFRGRHHKNYNMNVNNNVVNFDYFNPSAAGRGFQLAAMLSLNKTRQPTSGSRSRPVPTVWWFSMTCGGGIAQVYFANISLTRQ